MLRICTALGTNIALYTVSVQQVEGTLSLHGLVDVALAIERESGHEPQADNDQGGVLGVLSTYFVVLIYCCCCSSRYLRRVNN